MATIFNQCHYIFWRQKNRHLETGSLEHQLNKYSLDVCSVAQLPPEKCVDKFKLQIGQPLDAHNYNMLQLNPKRFISDQGCYLDILIDKVIRASCLKLKISIITELSFVFVCFS